MQKALAQRVFLCIFAVGSLQVLMDMADYNVTIRDAALMLVGNTKTEE